MTNMQELLRELNATKLVKLTGSYADGTQTLYSDLDFYVKEDAPDKPYAKRNMLKIIEILNRHKIVWHSTGSGYISTIGERNPKLHIELEFADLFNKRKNKLPTVTLYGVTFKTH